jgi:hypothetical protein
MALDLILHSTSLLRLLTKMKVSLLKDLTPFWTDSTNESMKSKNFLINNYSIKVALMYTESGVTSSAINHGYDQTFVIPFCPASSSLFSEIK